MGQFDRQALHEAMKNYNTWEIMKYSGTWASGILVPTSAADVTFYVDYTNGLDSTSNTGTILLPFKTVEYAINIFGENIKYWKSLLTLNIVGSYTAKISLFNYNPCFLIINFTDTISEIELYNMVGGVSLNGNNTGEILKLRTMFNRLLYINNLILPLTATIECKNECKLRMSDVVLNDDFSIEDTDNVVISNATIDTGKTLTLTRVKGHLSDVTGAVVTASSILTRVTSPNVTGTNSLISAN